MLQRRQPNFSDTRFHALRAVRESEVRSPMSNVGSPKSKVEKFAFDLGYWTSDIGLILSSSRGELLGGGETVATRASILASAEDTESKDADEELEDAARSERGYVRERLREELKREPSEQEVDEWLRQHTEGY